mgnify:CR=1 FL=1
MNRCPRCGAPILPYQNFCTACGLNLQPGTATHPPASAAAPGGALTPLSAPDPAERAIPYFVWSLLLFFFLNPLGAPLAIVAAFYATRAHAAPQKKQDLYIARLLCILSTVITGGTLVILVTVLIARGTA